MGNQYFVETKYGWRRIGKVVSPLNDRLKNVEWGEYRIGDLFEVTRGLSMYVKDKESFVYVSKSDPNAIPLVQQMNHSNGISAYIDKSKLPQKFKNKIERAGKISINPDQPLSYYQETKFIGNSVIIIDTSKLSKYQAIYLVGEIQRIRKGSTWNDKFPKSEVKIAKIQLPTKNGKVDFDFIERLVLEIERERILRLENYLSEFGLSNYHLNEKENEVLRKFESGVILLEDFTYKSVFNKIKQGRRLKKNDQISGNIPFVMSGVTNTGVINYISNPVASFPNNSITVDIFGNTFYRNYAFGAGDDTGVYWNDKIKYSEETMMYFASAMRKSVSGKFDYGNKLRSSKSFDFKMKLPVKDKKPDYETMETIISAIHKLVIKDVVLYVARKKKELNKLTENANA